MTAAPLFSTITLGSEFLVTAGVLYTFWSGYARAKFPYALVAVTLGYETLVNVSYMVMRTATHGGTAQDSAFDVGLAIFHGSFSLLMYVALIAFLIVAWRRYRTGDNFFRAHPRFLALFITLWLIAVLSGFLFYAVAYLA